MGAAKHAPECESAACINGKLSPMRRKSSRKGKIIAWSATVLTVGAIGLFAQQRWLRDVRAVQIGGAPTDIAPEAKWPWPAAKLDKLAHGVTHWRGGSASDGTVCELIEFDFAAHPNLRFEMFDQDADDTKPWIIIVFTGNVAPHK